MFASPSPTDDTSPSDEETEVPPEVIQTLQHGRRRTIVELLHTNEGLTLVTLANQLAEIQDIPLPTTLTQLHDQDLPELTTCKVIEYDDDTGDITLVLDTATVAAALEQTSPDE